MSAADRNAFLLGSRVRFKDAAVGRLRGLETSIDPWALNALLIQVGLLGRQMVRVPADAVGGAERGRVNLKIVRSDAEAIERDYRPQVGAQNLDRRIQFNLAAGPVKRLGLEFGGLIVDQETGKVTDFVGISLIRRKRLLLPVAKAGWQREGLIWVDLGPDGYAKAATYG